MKYLIDTNICIYIMNKRPVEVLNKFKKLKLGEIGISTISVSELQYGVRNSKYREKNKKRLAEFLAPFEILSFDEMAAEIYGDIRFKLEKRGQPVGPLDQLIAAHALSQGLILVTNTDKEFKRFQNLKVENWVN